MRMFCSSLKSKPDNLLARGTKVIHLLCFHWNRLVFTLPWWSSPWKTKPDADIWEIVTEVCLFHRHTAIPCSHLPLVKEAWKHFKHLECSTGGIHKADAGLASHKIPVPTAAGERDLHRDVLWIRQCCSKRGEKGNEQAQREGATTAKTRACVPLLLFLDNFPQYKSTKTKTNRTHFPWDKVTGRGVQRSTIHLRSLLPTKGTAVGQIRTGSSNLACLTAPRKAKHDLRHHIFLRLAFSFRQWQEPSASSTPFQFFDKGY